MDKQALIHYVQETMIFKTGCPNIFEIRAAVLQFTSDNDKVEIRMYIYQSQGKPKFRMYGFKIFINQQTPETFDNVLAKNGSRFFVSSDLYEFYSGKILTLLEEFR